MTDRPRSETLQVAQEKLWAETRKVGFVRQIWQARKWYGADWWLAAISAVGLLIFIIIGLFPGLFAPYEFNEQAGPQMMAPGEQPDAEILIVPVALGITDVQQLDDQAVDEDGNPKASLAPNVGSIDAISSSAVGSLRDEGVLVRPVRLQSAKPEITPQESLDALIAGEIDALVGSQQVYAPLLENYPDLMVVGTVGQAFEGNYLMGTTQLGYDVFSRLVYGTRTTLTIGIVSALFSSLFGIPLGLISGFAGGTFDRLMTLVMDSLYSFPGLILAIAIAAVLGPGIGNIILAIAVLYIPTYFRIVRGQTLSIKEALYVEAARGLGASRFVILYKYIFPNVIASVVVIFSVNVADAILTGAGLSFLGLGLPETIPDWGVDLAKGQLELRSAWWLVTFPGLAIALLTLCFSLLGESLSEILNPRLNRN
jgi:peptide/nickel transport system permease protein